ncbi:hypothetical protein LTR08_000870 [Meristemomyces frigidus]|nr:hypothetical protein LTR08_000870 [Meristemomyces frigidus]
MASLLSTHLEQMALCSTSIATLSFPGPKQFTNALLSTHDITALIRDTESHERALFHLAPPQLPTKVNDFASSVSSAAPTTTAARRATAFGGVRQPKSRAVAAVLGGDLYQKTRKAPTDGQGRQKGEIDVEVLLEGAEKLAAVYPIPGATDKIAALRRRHEQLAANIAHYEDRVARNTQELQLMNRPNSRHAAYAEEEEEEVDEVGVDEAGGAGSIVMTKEDLEREEQEIRELERKKRSLEQRVSGMERDLGGLMR